MHSKSCDTECSALSLLYSYSVALWWPILEKESSLHHLWNSYLCLWSEAAQIDDITKGLRSNGGSRSGRCCVGGQWGVVSCILLTYCDFAIIVGMGGFCIFYFFPCEPDRVLEVFWEMYTKIFKNVSRECHSSEGIRGDLELVRAKDALLPEIHLEESDALDLSQNSLSQLGTS